jgi:hypothetical protein
MSEHVSRPTAERPVIGVSACLTVDSLASGCVLCCVVLCCIGNVVCVCVGVCAV